MLCSKCKYEKNEDRFEFRKDRGCFRTVCKDCKNERIRTKYPEISEDLSKRRKEIRVENKEGFNEKARERYWKNRDILLDKARNRPGYGKCDHRRVKAWREVNKYKCSAHQAVARAIKKGSITKPERCQVCGSCEKLNAHHYDYQKPLEVVWLCIPCHKKIHSKYFNKGGE